MSPEVTSSPIDPQELQRLVARRLRWYREDPSLIVKEGLCWLFSEFSIDPKTGERVPIPEGQPRRTRYIPTRNQKRLIAFRDQKRRKGEAVDGIILKARFIGATADIQSHFASRLATQDGVQAITVTHQTGSDKEIYDKYLKHTLEHLPAWLAPTDYPRNSKEELKIVNETLGITSSGARCTSSTNINSLRGQRCLLLHESECSRFDCLDEVQAVLGGIMHTSDYSEHWRESTACGKDPYFSVGFDHAWKLQGSCNYWEPGFQRDKSQTTAFFFAGFKDPGKSVALPRGMTPRKFLEIMDGDEKELLTRHMLPYFMGELKLPEMVALERACAYLSWRRAKMQLFAYPGWPVEKNVGVGYYSIVAFHREEPNTIEEAFETATGTLALSEKDILWMESQCNNDFKAGYYNNEGMWDDDPSTAFVKVWEPPKEGCQYICAYDGAGGAPNFEDYRADRAITTERLRRDFCWGVVFKIVEESGRKVAYQVAELMTQAPQHLSAEQMINLAMAYRSKGNRTTVDEPEEWPRLSWEVNWGQSVADLAVKRGYPLSRIHRRSDESVVGPQRNSNMGWWKSKATTISGVQQLQARVVTRTIVCRSHLLVAQARHYVEDSTGWFGAAAKGKGGWASKDDGMTTLVQFCHCWNFGRVIHPTVFGPAEGVEVQRDLYRPDGNESILEFEDTLLRAAAEGTSLSNLPPKPGTRLVVPMGF